MLWMDAVTGINRVLKTFNLGDTLIRLTKDNGNLYDYTVTCEDIRKGTYARVTYPHLTDADQAWGTAFSQARGEDDDLQALMGIR